MKTLMYPAAFAHLIKQPLVRLGAAGLLAGGMAFLVAGDTPASSPAASSGGIGFDLPTALPVLPLAPSLLSQPVWASEPAEVAEVALAMPAPRLIAVVSSASGRLAVFEWPDGRRVRIGVESLLEGEGLIETISPTGARWRRADGTVVEAMLFGDPTPRVASP